MSPELKRKMFPDDFESNVSATERTFKPLFLMFYQMFYEYMTCFMLLAAKLAKRQTFRPQGNISKNKMLSMSLTCQKSTQKRFTALLFFFYYQFIFLCKSFHVKSV